MTTPAQLPPILPVIPENIPAALKAERRWAPWAAEWNPKANHGKGKYSKIPYRADKPGAGLANNSTRGWTTFEAAMAAYLAAPGKFAGVGYVLTGDKKPDGPANVFSPGRFVGVDLDHCRDPQTGEIAEWATDLMGSFASYTEVSPSGTGLRAILEFQLPQDCMDHAAGVEIYGGVKARFVTLTGQHVAGTPRAVCAPPAGAVEVVVAKYGKTPSRAQVEDLHLPPLLSDMELPDISELDLPPRARNFLSDGPEPGADRSKSMFSTAVEMVLAGCTREQIYTIFEANEHAIEIALGHRRQDYDRALRYIWKEHCCAGATRAAQIRKERDDVFEVLDPEPSVGEPDDLFDLLGGDPAPGPSIDASLVSRDLSPLKVEKAKFAISDAGAFADGPPQQWIIKGVLPRAEVGMVYGESTAGKSFIMIDMLACIVRGEPWRGMRTKPGRVVMVVAEGASGARGRLKAYAQHHQIDLSALPFGIIPDTPNLRTKDDVKELAARIKEWGGADVIVVDTLLASVAGANENSSDDMGEVLANCRRLNRETEGAMVILVHHAGKDASRGARGWSGLKGNMDVQLEVTRDKLVGRAIRLEKSKDGAEGKAMGFKLHVVTIGTDEDGDPITSCVVEHSAGDVASVDPVDGLKEPHRAVLKVLTDAEGMADSLPYVTLHAAALALIEPSGRPDNDKRSIERAVELLTKKGYIGKTEGGEIELLERK